MLGLRRPRRAVGADLGRPQRTGGPGQHGHDLPVGDRQRRDLQAPAPGRHAPQGHRRPRHRRSGLRGAHRHRDPGPHGPGPGGHPGPAVLWPPVRSPGRSRHRLARAGWARGARSLGRSWPARTSCTVSLVIVRRDRRSSAVARSSPSRASFARRCSTRSRAACSRPSRRPSSDPIVTYWAQNVAGDNVMISGNQHNPSSTNRQEGSFRRATPI